METLLGAIPAEDCDNEFDPVSLDKIWVESGGVRRDAGEVDYLFTYEERSGNGRTFVRGMSVESLEGLMETADELGKPLCNPETLIPLGEVDLKRARGAIDLLAKAATAKDRVKVVNEVFELFRMHGYSELSSSKFLQLGVDRLELLTDCILSECKVLASRYGFHPWISSLKNFTLVGRQNYLLRGFLRILDMGWDAELKKSFADIIVQCICFVCPHTHERYGMKVGKEDVVCKAEEVFQLLADQGYPLLSAADFLELDSKSILDLRCRLSSKNNRWIRLWLRRDFDHHLNIHQFHVLDHMYRRLSDEPSDFDYCWQTFWQTESTHANIIVNHCVPSKRSKNEKI